MHPKRLIVLAAVALVSDAALAQQAPAVAAPPPGWQWVLDAPARLVNGGRFAPTDTTFEFAHMAPGWHITMGPGATLFDPRERAEGRFVVQGELILFPDASGNEYGVFVGGRALDGAAQHWFAFLVRADGSAAVMHRSGAETRSLMPWTMHAAVKPKPSGSTVTNVIAVRAEPDSVRFVVNGERLAAFARSTMEVDGQFGFRIGRGVNLHITNLDVTRRLAPFPQRR